ncbi:RNA-binding S4 domain-containing protein [Gleimia sp. 6138-11-ORH1]|uniref:RNA-binding S4 domain-containing protein n=1 Tax=Gleimia sp. 6138-11-ORH1 TaxID=2973937 RepID=UPI002168941A|nr:RNA-binding S4 domain-containing protein [Gleimia sp. 6138-11-ORH1]MCS4484835.1 RNA-binding S4 domain-containing protein [Gleimia sp. 6138-11-ORH1]
MSDTVRVDIWLWSVRKMKSRSLATTACRAGHVKVNGNTVKASHKIKVGDMVSYRFEGFDRSLEVLQILTKRVGASLAEQAYIDHSPPRPKFSIVLTSGVRLRGSGRPTKRERRQLDSLRGRNTNLNRYG